MIYHVIIALNSEGKRKVGRVVSVLESKGLDLVKIRRKETSSKAMEFPDEKMFVIMYQLERLEAMNYYRHRFDDGVIKKKLDHLFGNHVELVFDSGESVLDQNELWEAIAEYAFDNAKKLPFMFVVMTNGANGFDGSFFPSNFEPEEQNYFNHRSAIPLEK